MKNNLLNIVNKQSKIIGQASREEIHAKGLLHQEVHVWFYTPKQEIIFQLRSKNKDTWPDKLDASVGGHVEIGQSYEQAAIREVKEETGLDIKISDLNLISIMKHKSFDTSTNKINNTLRAIYAYKYSGDIKNLQIEPGKSQGFEAWPLKKLVNITNENKQRFIPMIFDNDCFQIFKQISKLELWQI